ncbi:hypothetical protein [Bacillus sp. J33]|uniref:hypothetical protein n=1 Tax=Bacillus sp. J33 TaxID=935836 RepID=UPI00047B810B|nr:hypothetical protein [Bacillus sp. J33]
MYEAKTLIPAKFILGAFLVRIDGTWWTKASRTGKVLSPFILRRRKNAAVLGGHSLFEGPQRSGFEDSKYKL